MIPAQLFPSLEILRFEFQMAVPSGFSSSFYLGSTWRGILGWELKKLLCPFPPSTKCPGCDIRRSCPYYVLFEKKTNLQGITDAPRGYILYAPDLSRNKQLSLEVTLVGYCARFIAPVLHAMAKIQNRGLGKERITFQIESVVEDTPEGNNLLNLEKDILSQINGPFSLEKWLSGPTDVQNSYSLSLKTPLRLRKRGKYLDDLDLPFMFMSIARRLEALNCVFSGGQMLGKKTWLELESMFRFLDKPFSENELSSDSFHSFEKNISWDDFSRFSNRQKRKVPMGGLVGECSFNTNLAGIGQWLRCAELVHVGKGTAMGLGRVEMK